MKILEAATKKQLEKQQVKLHKNPLSSETKGDIESLFHRATYGKTTESVTATKNLIKTHEELHRKTAPPLTP